MDLISFEELFLLVEKAGSMKNGAVLRQFLAATSLFLTASVGFGQVPAFPGAYGFGASATGGRGGAVYHVTNLNDSGPGSFRNAVSQGNRTIVFDVGGYIVLQSAVPVASNITIAGQTAPGDGIGVMGAEVSLSNQSNIIIRNMRFRQGTFDPNHGKSALNMGNGSNIILDHCSFEYGQWDTIDAVKTTNFTVQDSIIADPIYQQFGAHVEVGPSTFYRNLWVNAHNRQPLAKDNTQYINNIIYDFQAAYTVANTGGYFSHDIVNNYFIAGPATTSSGNAFFQINNKQSVYASGNFLDSNMDGTLNGSPNDTAGSALVLTSPWAPSTSSIPALNAQDAYASVVQSAGASPRDEVDSLVVQQTQSLGTEGQLIKDQSTTGLSNNGYGTLNSGPQFQDTNGDGIPDYWAIANGLNAMDASIGTAMYGSTGYTNLEVYANSLLLPDPWTAHNLNGPSVPGATSFNPFTGTWLLICGAVDTGSNQGEVASQLLSSNGTVFAKVTGLEQFNKGVPIKGAGPHAKAGIMMRNTNDAASAFVSASVTANHELWFEWRGAASSAVHQTSIGSFTSQKGPLWLKLTRGQGVITAWWSLDGTRWQPFASAPDTLSSAVCAGLITSSDNPELQSLGSFTNVSVENE